VNQILTERQKEIYHFVKKYHAEKGYSPTIREICEEVGFASSSSAFAHLQKLEFLGYIERKPECPRTIIIKKELVCNAGS